MMKKRFFTPDIEIVTLDEQDVIKTSGGNENELEVQKSDDESGWGGLIPTQKG